MSDWEGQPGVWRPCPLRWNDPNRVPGGEERALAVQAEPPPVGAREAHEPGVGIGDLDVEE